MNHKLTFFFTLISVAATGNAHANLMCRKVLEANSVTTLEILNIPDGSEQVIASLGATPEHYSLDLTDEVGNDGYDVYTYSVKTLNDTHLILSVPATVFTRCGRGECPAPTQHPPLPTTAIWKDANHSYSFSCHEETEN